MAGQTLKNKNHTECDDSLINLITSHLMYVKYNIGKDISVYKIAKELILKNK